MIPRTIAERRPQSAGGEARFRRWAVSRLDTELAEEAVLVESSNLVLDETQGADSCAEWLTAAMPRVNSSPHKRQVYRWSAALRAASMSASRVYLRSRRRRARDVERESELRQTYLAEKKALKTAICRAKSRL